MGRGRGEGKGEGGRERERERRKDDFKNPHKKLYIPRDALQGCRRSVGNQGEVQSERGFLSSTSFATPKLTFPP